VSEERDVTGVAEDGGQGGKWEGLEDVMAREVYLPLGEPVLPKAVRKRSLILYDPEKMRREFEELARRPRDPVRRAVEERMGRWRNGGCL
jgi:hypothetical protein